MSKVKELEFFHHRYYTALWRFYISAIRSSIKEFYTPVLSRLILKEILSNRSQCLQPLINMFLESEVTSEIYCINIVGNKSQVKISAFSVSNR